MFAYYQVHPEALEEVHTAVAVQNLQSQGLDPAAQSDALAAMRDTLTQEEIGDRVFPHFIGSRLPVGITGLLISRFTTHASASDHVANAAGEESS